MKTVTELFNNFFQEFKTICSQHGRNTNEICIVAVSKKQSMTKIKEAFDLGHRDFGENYVQEADEKIQNLNLKNVRWHLIGPLQSNKINKVIGKFHLIHSVDSFKIAQELSQKSLNKNHRQKVLIQINFANEKSKSGFTIEEFNKNWSELKNLKGLDIQGLMCMPPLDDSISSFKEAQNLKKKLNLPYLSMGTTSDWKLAIQYGSTHIRIGTALFGERT